MIVLFYLTSISSNKYTRTMFPFSRNAAAILAATLAAPLCHAETLYEETFDGAGRKEGQSITELGWVSPGKEALLGKLGKGMSDIYLRGDTATPKDSESVFIRKIPVATQGIVTLSCNANAGAGGVASCIGLIPHAFSERRAEWVKTAEGWTFWVGRIDHRAPYYTDQPEGPILSEQESVACPNDTPVNLSLSVDLDRNKAWGEISWKDDKGQPQQKKTAEYAWDPLSGDVSGVFVVLDQREGRTGADFDNIKVEGTPHQLKPHPFKDTAHTIYQMNGREKPIPSPAEIQWISEKWPEGNAQMPYLVWLPETKELLMMVECKQPIVSAFIRSKDGGKTWSDRQWLHNGSDSNIGVALGLTYLGNGKVRAIWGSADEVEWISEDNGHSWSARRTPNGDKPILYFWDPALVLQEETKDKPARLIESGYRETGIPWGSDAGPYSQGYVRSSEDGGKTWTETKVPEWLGLNEITIGRAANGDLIAAARTDLPLRLAKAKLDHYAGLAVSRSSDEGKTWTKPDVLFDWGRHHPSLVTLKNGDMLMTYVVRLGYTRDKDGFQRFATEAIISKDHGKTWDLDHRIVLATWTGDIKGDNAWFSGVQSSSTVVLPDDTIVTAFGMGIRNAADTNHCLMDVAVVRWKLPENKLNSDRALRDAPFDSETRNLIASPLDQ